MSRSGGRGNRSAPALPGTQEGRDWAAGISYNYRDRGEAEKAAEDSCAGERLHDRYQSYECRCEKVFWNHSFAIIRYRGQNTPRVQYGWGPDPRTAVNSAIQGIRVDRGSTVVVLWARTSNALQSPGWPPDQNWGRYTYVQPQ